MIDPVQLLIALSVGIVSLLIYNIIYVPYRTTRIFQGQGIKGPAFKPLVGQMSDLIEWEKTGNRVGLLIDYSIKYGSVYYVCLAFICQLSVNEPLYLGDLLRKKASSFSKGKLSHEYVAAILGAHNLVIEEGDQHAKHRRMINPAFQHANLIDMMDIMIKQTKQHVAKWVEPSKKNQSVDLNGLLSELTLDIITLCAFGEGFHSLPDYHSIIHNGFAVNELNVQWRFRNMVSFIPFLKDLPILRKPLIDQTRARLQGLVDTVITERQAGRSTSARPNKLDLLDLLLDARDPSTGEGFSAQEIRDEAMTFCFAGHETTAQALTWTFYVLMKRPELWKQIVDEVKSVCGDDASPSWQQIGQLSLVEAVLQESMRLYSPAGTIARQAMEDVTLEGKGKPDLFIPAGTMIAIDLSVIHRNEEYWGPKAAEFDHTRWLGDKRPTSMNAYMYVPFSAGSRNCIGMNFAMLEAKILLAIICQSCSMKLMPGLAMADEKLDLPSHSLAVTMKVKNGMPVMFEKRQ